MAWYAGFITGTSKWMLFVDGEGLTIRSQEFAEEGGFEIPQGNNYLKNVFVWPTFRPWEILAGYAPASAHLVRAYYYTSLQGDSDKIEAVERQLWDLGFQPQVFKKHKQSVKSKGVDITLAKDMLSHAYHDHYDVAVLVAGDGDFVPLVDEVKRMGKIVCIAFIDAPTGGLSPKLKLAGDAFVPIENVLTQRCFRQKAGVQPQKP